MSSAESSPLPVGFDDESRASHSAAVSTAPSSPPGHPLSEYSRASSELEIMETKVAEQEAADEAENLAFTSERLQKLQTVLERSTIYSNILRERLEEDRKRQTELLEQEQRKAGSKRSRTSERDVKGKKKLRRGKDGDAEAVEEEDKIKTAEELGVFQQPKLITGAKLKPYQLEGLQWMVSLDQNGISGILADEMGLGKTLQTIAFSAYLRERNNSRPFLVVCPLSVLHNWVAEYEKFAPEIPVCMYHGTPAERAELRNTVMSLDRTEAVQPKQKGKSPTTKKGRGRPRPSTSGRKSSRKAKVDSDSEDELNSIPVTTKPTTSSFPIVITTYDIIMRDRIHLSRYEWGYIVVDEGHRLKNLNCKLMKEIKKYSSAGRMILTGTPLHNNLAELWSLLNFILPDIFDDIETFQEWFSLPTLQQSLPQAQSNHIISSLHAILKPFLLRRLKVDVEMNLPPKKEYVLYAPLSVRQREAYDKVLDGNIRDWLISGGTAGNDVASASPLAPEPQADEADDEPVSKRRGSRRAKGTKSYAVDGDDDEYFEMLERGEVDQTGVKRKLTREEEAEEEARVGREHQLRVKVKQVNNMRLQNVVMQLRKVCSHPFLFDWPVDAKTKEPVLGEELVNASGKMMVLDRLLRELFRRDHKVLIFSQFTTMLDILQDWAVDGMGWNICRIDGSSSPMQRKAEMERFQTSGDAPDAPRLFLLSTRAGGLGINLVAADTVIFYDQDWNPQMDIQAQDRAHRIGQTRPVLIFRLLSAHTIETTIMQRATEKRKLEALVIAKGKFRKPAAAASNKRETMAEYATDLLRLEGEKITVVPNTQEGKAGVLNDEELNMLLDRSPEVFSDRGKGWTSTAAAGESLVSKTGTVHGKRTAFAVYEAPVEVGNDALAHMFGEDANDD
ncbi:SNF2 family DNA-dependent ATPase [Coprinopsis marcescibilis]|uniref:SNF2 family DNA-dependent ATPase n=1 Tax=Coprinopsis marcescibilis TaxID=230819 RepID=A0A5C3KNP0_COPMA|nr:SNF2 family DNA-dependent ATPase [Coprinopsis marcescibilis]